MKQMKKSSELNNNKEINAKKSKQKVKNGCLDGFLVKVKNGCILVNTGQLEKLANGQKINFLYGKKKIYIYIFIK
jgi:hypothetical protein